MLRDSIPVVLLILAFFFTAHDAAKAEVATAQEMEWVCRNWLAYIMNDQGGWAGSAKPSIAGFHDIQEKGFLLGRCFAVAPMGYVVVPSLKELPPVKAYSEENGYGGPASEGLPRMVKDVLLHRVELFIKTYGSLDACQPSTGEVLFDRCNRKAWDWLLVNPILFKASLDPDVQKSLT